MLAIGMADIRELRIRTKLVKIIDACAAFKYVNVNMSNFPQLMILFRCLYYIILILSIFFCIIFIDFSYVFSSSFKYLFSVFYRQKLALVYDRCDPSYYCSV